MVTHGIARVKPHGFNYFGAYWYADTEGGGHGSG